MRGVTWLPCGCDRPGCLVGVADLAALWVWRLSFPSLCIWDGLLGWTSSFQAFSLWFPQSKLLKNIFSQAAAIAMRRGDQVTVGDVGGCIWADFLLKD